MRSTVGDACSARDALVSAPMRATVALLLAAGCGRVGFEAHDASADTAPPDIPPGLLAGCELYLAMDEPTWSQGLVDGCGDHPATATDGASPVADAVRGAVGAFTGGTSCVYVPDAPELRGGSAVTVSAWVRANRPTAESFGIVSKRTSYQRDAAYSVFLWDELDEGLANHLFADIDTEDDRYEDVNTEFLVGAWHQVTMVYDGMEAPAARIRLYVDGAPSASAPETAQVIPVPATPPPVAIGCLPVDDQVPQQSLEGALDDVIIWSRALPDDEVADWYSATLR